MAKDMRIWIDLATGKFVEEYVGDTVIVCRACRSTRIEVEAGDGFSVEKCRDCGWQRHAYTVEQALAAMERKG